MTKLVIDSNILISTLMNPKGIVGTFLLEDLHHVEKLSCYMLYVEVFDKKEKIIKYTKLEEGELLEVLYMILKQINFVNELQISEESWVKAEELTSDIDVKDISFVAMAIETGGILWTGDKKLIRGLTNKGFEQVVDLEELRNLIRT